MAEAVARPEVAAARRVVVKLGTRVLTHDDGSLALSRMFALVEAIAGLRRAGKEVLLVSSGAVGLGREALGFKKGPLELVEHQACAAVGQSRLMGLYEQGFTKLGLVCAQVLLTQGNFDDRARYLSIRGSLATLLRLGVVPVINQNDAVATTEELSVKEDDSPHIFGDNDRLAALVATKLGADLLILLTDVGGVYDGDPRKSAEARLISRVDDVDTLGGAAGKSSSGGGRGGMKSKVLAAEIAQRGGCQVVIASGRDPQVARIAAGEEVGTWFPARGDMDARLRWIAFAAPPRGVLQLDPGAVEALRHKAASLLAAGVLGIQGEFQRGDVVELRGPEGTLVGRGRMLVDSAEARRWLGEKGGDRSGRKLVRRDQLVLEGSGEGVVPRSARGPEPAPGVTAAEGEGA